MRVNSFKKIQKQVESYVNSVFVVQDEIKNQIEILEQELAKYSKRWSDIRDAFCNGSPCICKTQRYFALEIFDDLGYSVEVYPESQVQEKLNQNWKYVEE